MTQGYFKEDQTEAVRLLKIMYTEEMMREEDYRKRDGSVIKNDMRWASVSEQDMREIKVTMLLNKI